jgi:6-phosphofructokinase 1
LRGKGFQEAFRTLRTLVRTRPHPPRPDQQRLRLAVLTAGGPAPGMNTAVRTAVRLGIDKGHIVLGVEQGFQGLIEGHIRELDWMSVRGWAWTGGSELGISRKVPDSSELAAVAANLDRHDINGLLLIGGWTAYQAAYQLMQARMDYPVFNIPIVCLPASINNNLPGAAHSVGADTALNSIVEAVDKIKQSAVAAHRVFVVEVMGRYCGYLALLGALATGAERVYLHEEGVTLRNLQADVDMLVAGFKQGKRLGLMIRNERANVTYTTPFICSLFEEEGGPLFEVRQSILGHLQQGGAPSPFDRIQATRLATRCMEFLDEYTPVDEAPVVCVGLRGSTQAFTPLADLPMLADVAFQRPYDQWWMELRRVARMLAQPGPGWLPAPSSLSRHAEEGEPDR